MQGQKVSRKGTSPKSLVFSPKSNKFKGPDFSVLTGGLDALEGALRNGISRSPFLTLPYIVALPVFILLLGVLSPWMTPGRDFNLHGAVLQIPHDGKLPTLLENTAPLSGVPALVADTSVPQPASPKLVVTQTYTVQPGDVLSVIANRFNLNLGTIISWNNIQNVRHIYPGSKLIIPSADGLLYVVKSGDSLTSIARAHNLSYEDILQANGLKTPVVVSGQRLFLPGATLSNWDLKQALGTLFIYPARGVITSPFGWRRDPFTGVRTFHNGVDLANYAGTPVHASMAGRVVDMGFNSGYGNYVVLSHEGGFQTLYGHLRAFEVSQGEWVEQGQVIGRMGSTGYSTGPHVHFSIFLRNRAVNPLNYLY
jgi:murein DD-endopeptidase MepM/ murein hydrolase activator NlpD